MPKPIRFLVLGTLVFFIALLMAQGLPARSTDITSRAVITAPDALDSTDAETQRLTRLRALHARLLALPQRTSFQDHMLEQIRVTNRFPPNNRLFSSTTEDPVLVALAPDTKKIHSDDGRTYLTLRCDKRQYLPGETAKVQAFVTDTRSAQTLPAHLQAQLIFNEHAQLTTIHFTDFDRDHVYIATIPTGGDTPLQQGLYQLQVSTQQGISC